ncbi:phenylalanine--tRNA ligase subunit alpha [Candidatus Woesearchaeota archaeon]|nr:phenylalanine--tRNA ligase subunit alpha [Candidatus Woesearchaeota archaeon]
METADIFQSLILKLHPLERAVLPQLIAHDELSKIAKAAKLDETETMRALQWLENKGALHLQKQKKQLIFLGKNGTIYKKSGMPEKLFLGALSDEFKGVNVIIKKSKLSREEATAALGILRKKNALDLKKEQELLVKITLVGKTMLSEQFPEEKFLQQNFPVELEKIENKILLDLLLKRKELLKVEEKTETHVALTDLGRQLAEVDLGAEVTNRLTPKMLKEGSWKKQQFRAYDVEVNVPAIYGGRKHIEQQAIEYIKRIWLDLGFKEMTGNYVQSAFWDLDALFVPQDHPAREMQDTFYLNKKAQLPEMWKTIKKVHETGEETESKGWGGEFKKEETEQVLLRTHTTVLSARTLANLKKEDLPAKFFAVGKVFRNEALDWKHLFEFYQIEGIVVDPQANLQNLKGYLTQFYKKMGYSKVRMRPAHFPYTEPSLEVDVFHPGKQQWIELGGAGIFRPEVVIPLLGFDCPVLAWGQGLARIIGEYWNMQDIRDLYKNDVKQLREWKVFLR